MSLAGLNQVCNNILRAGGIIGMCLTGNFVFTGKLTKFRKLFN